MPPTVLSLYARYGPRLGPWVALADLPDALASALHELGGSPSRPVVDADLVGVTAALAEQFDDLVLARAYETILNNLTDDLLRENGINEKAADWRPSFERRLAKLEAKLKTKYGVGLPVPTAGIISLNFAAQGDDTIDGVPA